MITCIDQDLPEGIVCAYCVETSESTLYLMFQPGVINGRRVYFSAWHDSVESAPCFTEEKLIYEILRYDELDEDVFPYLELEVRMRHRHGPPIGRGRHRVVFRDGDEVIKVPSIVDGEYSNDREIQIYSNAPENHARCWVDTSLTEEFGHLISRMEFVTQTIDCKNLPSWVGAVDGFQVGYTKDRRLVAYDFGY